MFARLSFFTLIAASYALKSPVLIWSSSRGLSDLPQSYTGQTINSEDFHKSYLKPLAKDNNLVIFLQDRLSLQDLNQHADVYNPYSDGGAFKNIKAFMDDQFSVQIPSVMSPWSALEKMMKDFEGKIHQLKDSTKVSDLDLGGQANLIIVTLTPVQGSSNDGKIFGENDQRIAEVTKSLTKRGVKYAALYTGETAAKVSDVEAGVSRRLQSVTDIVSNSNYTFMNITCKNRPSPLYFYMRRLEISVEQNEKSLNDSQVLLEDDGTTCDNDTVVLKLNSTNKGMNLKLEWTIVNDNISEAWNVKYNMINIDWTNNSVNIKANDTLVMEGMSAPKDFSYHCSSFVIKSPKVNATANFTLTFDGLQIQPFNIMDEQFSDGWDCVYFFTPGIWMAIISVSIMTLIVIYGLGMIASLKTMDRYDDPKGKTITVNVNE